MNIFTVNFVAVLESNQLAYEKSFDKFRQLNHKIIRPKFGEDLMKD